MAFVSKKSHAKEARKTTSRKYMTKIKIPTKDKSTSYMGYCPRDCTQELRVGDSGKIRIVRGKKTYNKTSKKCLNCGFILGR